MALKWHLQCFEPVCYPLNICGVSDFISPYPNDLLVTIGYWIWLLLLTPSAQPVCSAQPILNLDLRWTSTMAALNEADASAPHDAFDAGKHCAKADCHSLDFLPLTCPHCQLAFCGPHAPTFYHDCHVFQEKSTASSSLPAGSNIDAVKKLVSAHTPAPSIRQDNDRKAQARQILASRFPSSKERQSVRPAKELSPQIKLILLKRKAISGDPRKKEGDVTLNFRWYGTFQCDISVSNVRCCDVGQRFKSLTEPKAVWFSKKTVTGKVFDLTIEMFKTELISKSSSLSPSDLQLMVLRPESQFPVILTEDCSKDWGEVVKDGEEVWLTQKL
ncbi:hypothetical protein O181_001973 [Austropuccinia psidii MF-1]|uniref:AN1-type domain-containing protein n=1 Tax=Austropuccinia psidii MF-1 TaxID=1389203 RepID=A0A9Q3BBJ3_9BASI|nr:hypothetical protein [Austropuccinia psidii MF-1]